MDQRILFDFQLNQMMVKVVLINQFEMISSEEVCRDIQYSWNKKQNMRKDSYSLRKMLLFFEIFAKISILPIGSAAKKCKTDSKQFFVKFLTFHQDLELLLNPSNEQEVQLSFFYFRIKFPSIKWDNQALVYGFVLNEEFLDSWMMIIW